MKTVYDPMYHGECNRSEIKCQEYASQGETPLLEHTLQGDIKDITGSLECPLAPPFPPEVYGYKSKRKWKWKYFKKLRRILSNAYEYYERGRHATFLDSLLDAWIEEYFEEYMYEGFLRNDYSFHDIEDLDDLIDLNQRYFEFEIQGHRFENKWRAFWESLYAYNWAVWRFYTRASWGAEIWYHANFDWYNEKFQLRADGAEELCGFPCMCENRKRKWLL